MARSTVPPRTERGTVKPSKPAMTVAEFEAGLFDLTGDAEHKKLMIYGDSGCGKTVLASQLPGRVLYLAGEPGYISAARQGGKGKVHAIPDTATALAALNYLEEGGWAKYDWVVPDGLSTMNNRWLLSYTAEAFDRNPASRAHRNLPDKPDYFNAQNFTKSWVSRMIDLPVNVLVTAHAMRPEDPDGDLLVYPQIQGKGYEVANAVAGLFHVVGYMEMAIEEGTEALRRRVLWQRYKSRKTGTTYFAKDQYDVLGLWSDIRDPDNPRGVTMPDVIGKIDASNNGKPSKARKR